MTQSRDLVQEPIARKWYIIEQTLTSEKNSFSIRIAKYWNKLQENIVNGAFTISINSFKNRLDKHWKYEELYYANYKADISGSRVTYREIEESGEEEP